MARRLDEPGMVLSWQEGRLRECGTKGNNITSGK
jgi:hypothetical protein